jgi:FAD/FMN-containing dehydrogenase
MCKDVVVSMAKYNRVHMIDCDKAIVMVQSGILLEDLHRKLRSFDLGLPNCGETADQTLAGAISTGYHGEARASQTTTCRRVSIERDGLLCVVGAARL